VTLARDVAALDTTVASLEVPAEPSIDVCPLERQVPVQDQQQLDRIALPVHRLLRDERAQSS
jgi:hypothetical protein